MTPAWNHNCCAYRSSMFSVSFSCTCSISTTFSHSTRTLQKQSYTSGWMICFGLEIKSLRMISAGSSLNGSNGEDGGPIGGEMLTLCSVREEHIYISSIASHIDSLLTLIFPFFIITYLNVRIAICVWKLKDQRKNIVASTKISHSSSNTLLQQAQLQQHQQQLTSNKKDAPHPSSGCQNNVRLPSSRSNPLLNGMGNNSSSGGGSLNNHYVNSKSCRINMGSSSTSLNSGTAPNNPHLTAGRNTVHKGQSGSSSTSAAEARVTKTLLLVSTSFLVLNLPAHAIRAVAYVQVSKETRNKTHEILN